MNEIIKLLERANQILSEIENNPAAAAKWTRRGWTKHQLLADQERATEIIAAGFYEGDPITAVRTFRGRKAIGNLQHVADVRDGDF